MTALSEQPFWIVPSDPHRMASAMQAQARPLAQNYAAASGNWRHQLVSQEFVWATAIHRIVTEGIRPEQTVGEAILRIKEILSGQPPHGRALRISFTSRAGGAPARRTRLPAPARDHRQPALSFALRRAYVIRSGGGIAAAGYASRAGEEAEGR